MGQVICCPTIVLVYWLVFSGRFGLMTTILQSIWPIDCLSPFNNLPHAKLFEPPPPMSYFLVQCCIAIMIHKMWHDMTNIDMKFLAKAHYSLVHGNHVGPQPSFHEECYSSLVFWRVGQNLTCLLTPNFSNWQLHELLLVLHIEVLQIEIICNQIIFIV